jgi:hypothetical protein
MSETDEWAHPFHIPQQWYPVLLLLLLLLLVWEVWESGKFGQNTTMASIACISASTTEYIGRVWQCAVSKPFHLRQHEGLVVKSTAIATCQGALVHVRTW